MFYCTMASQHKVKIDVLKLDILLNYNYRNSNMVNNMCHLCKKHIMSPILVSKDNLNCSITEGKCKHLFHTECIDKHIKAGNTLCPIDMTPWNVDHIVDHNNMCKKLLISDTDKIKNPLLSLSEIKKK
ncbi:RING-H2 zinc finger [Catovirus CTV1]|uniref:RING-H2 zinc finger n=1 Tax=Catovirus CTV1 TaxID=1977631 RepID=A0A1V0SBS3_9VIRU|nr:RING-H2 zinc finger [Catovirus CTV1]